MQWFKKIHKWMSVIVGLQLIIWLITGLFFNLMDHQKAAGRLHYSAPATQQIVNYQNLIEPKQILHQYPDVVELTTTVILNQPYYLLNVNKGLYAHFANDYRLVNAQTGQIAELTETMVNHIALATLLLDEAESAATIINTQLLYPPIADFLKQQNPTWQVLINNDAETRIYIEAVSGRVIGHSDKHKQFADVFFMLHFMDYAQVGSFNNWPMIAMSFFVLWLSISGFFLVVTSLRKGKYYSF
ncbi:PepSY domain-containing protein [Shewanella gaetbuli]